MKHRRLTSLVKRYNDNSYDVSEYFRSPHYDRFSRQSFRPAGNQEDNGHYGKLSKKPKLCDWVNGNQL